MKRQSGYYWVKNGDRWLVGFYGGRGNWFVCGFTDELGNQDFDQINETRILAPDEVNDE